MVCIKNFIKSFDKIILDLKKRQYPDIFIEEVNKAFITAETLISYQQQKQILLQKKNILTKKGKETKDLVLTINSQLIQINNNILILEKNLKVILPLIPNTLNPDVIEGKNSEENVVISTYGNCIKKHKHHYHMGLIDNASYMTCARFVLLKGKIASLERILGNFLINFLIKKGFVEVSIPHLLSEESLYATGHIPKEKDNMFYIEDKNLYLIPTSECVLLNLMRNKTIKEDSLPVKYTAYNVNFRKEAGAAGKDTKGLIRLHQFPKVEMVAFTTEQESETMFQHFLQNSEEALRLLGLSYRIINLCSGDLGFNAKKTYDLEVWMCGSHEYREVSSISYCGDFQAYRLNSKYVDINKNNKILHTLNGTCLGVGRILAAIMEQNYDEIKNVINIPKVLIPYLEYDIIECI
jgi:seryl-tRNA synthetase